jgi:hypothetical protein
MYKEGIPQLDLFLVKGTEDAPDDGRYHVLLAGVIRGSYVSERLARAAYKELRDRLITDTGFRTGFAAPPTAEILRREANEAASRVKAGRKR